MEGRGSPLTTFPSSLLLLLRIIIGPIKYLDADGDEMSGPVCCPIVETKLKLYLLSSPLNSSRVSLE